MLIFEWLACVHPGAESDTAADLTPFPCTLGTPGAEGWTPLGDTLELELGFQGFLMSRVKVQAPDSAPSQVDALLGIDVEGQASMSQTQPAVPMPLTGNQRVSDDLLLFLTTGYSSWYVGRPVTVAVRLEGQAQYCVASADATLVDEIP